MAEDSIETPQPNSGLLFSSELASLSYDERKNLAQSYIDKFSRRTLDESILQETGITRENMKKDITETIYKQPGKTVRQTDPRIWELQTRINYCQSIVQSSPDKETYDRMRYSMTMTRADLRRIPPTDETVVVFEDPFFYYQEENQIRQEEVGEKENLLRTQQMLNRASSIFGRDEKVIMPTALVGVLYFNKSSQK